MAKKTGRISEYDKAGGDDKVPAITRQLCLMGATEEELAAAFGVTRRTITNWEQQHEQFKDAILEGRDVSDQKVVRSLFERATGYSHPEDKVFADAKTGAEHVVPTTKHYPPDTTAAIFWLKNRRPDEWRDKQVIDQNTKLSADDSLAAVLAAVDGKTKSV
ncbi:helix-turn-helix domain-containing protein [Leisingera sp. NJS204]|uniref:helix-turn-helix domain-containing protein n=1 Tax=Leisingera sp. NJS204 TaxID=2508307 RepID=UPI0010127B7D|nr:helix-turn-helix domain-containing protein [Leisingera sp. NJS204]QAX31304.1 terminase [Leisingera sp. NJS204]